ncbi:MAG: class I SAM-dependent methyltransferase [Patescibacteria group bacterium]
MINSIFKKTYPEQDQVFNCLENESFDNLIKKVEMETYSKRAGAFSEQNMLNLSKSHQKILSPLLAYPKNSIFLELGGGDGRFAIYLLKQGYQVIESDIALGSVKKVQTVAKKNNITNGHYAIIDAEVLPFKDNSLDAIFMVASLHHIPSASKAIKEIARVLKPNGHFLILREPASWQYTIFGPAFNIFRKVLRRKNKNEISLADDETKGFSKKQLIKFLTPNFKNIKLEPVHYIGKFLDNFVILINKFFKTKFKVNEILKKVCQNIDCIIACIPFIKNYPWDWDVYSQKK